MVINRPRKGGGGGAVCCPLKASLIVYRMAHNRTYKFRWRGFIATNTDSDISGKGGGSNLFSPKHILFLLKCHMLHKFILAVIVNITDVGIVHCKVFLNKMNAKGGDTSQMKPCRHCRGSYRQVKCNNSGHWWDTKAMDLSLEMRASLFVGQCSLIVGQQVKARVFNIKSKCFIYPRWNNWDDKQ